MTVADHVKEALSKHDKAETEYDPEWESWIAGEIAAYLQRLRDKGPDSKMGEDCLTSGTDHTKYPGVVGDYLLHLITRLKEIANEQ